MEAVTRLRGQRAGLAGWSSITGNLLYNLYNLFHDLQLRGNVEHRICLAAHLLDFNTRSQLRQGELATRPVHLEDTLYSKSEA